MTPNDQLKFERVTGADLKVNDTIQTWWQPKRDTIVSLRPYNGPLANLFPKGASIAGFAVGPSMTIDHADLFQRLVK